MPYTASLIQLPALLLLFKFENCGPNRAMQLLEPQCLQEFQKESVLMAKNLLEGPLEKW